MWRRTCKRLPVLLMAAATGCLAATADTHKQARSPLDELPPHITRITCFGQRADWSSDGKRILFIEKTFGDVYEVELQTKIIRPMTHHYFHEGYTRALYLSNGDILLVGARRFDATNPWASRSEKNAELWVLSKDLSRPPVPLGEKCSEGPAVSRRRMRIVWTHSGAFWSANIVYENGLPRLANKKKVLDKSDLPFKCEIETQNLRPPDEKELIFSAYGYQGTEVCGLNLETGEVVNYSNAPNQYDEPEGIFPDGKYTLVECDRHSGRGPQYIDIYKLALDGSGRTERLTFFADYPGYKASNPVVSDDGRYIAFQVARQGDPPGVGRGILVFDIPEFEKQARAGWPGQPRMRIQKMIDAINSAYGVTVHYKYDAEAFFPPSWLRKPISGRAYQMPEKEVERLLPVVEKFLSAYPKRVIQENLTDIYLVSDLEFYGQGFGAAYRDSSLYVNSDGQAEGYTEEFLLSQMHSELSSIFLRNYSSEFPEEAWKSANINGWEYRGTGVEMLGQADVFCQSEDLLEKGFLLKYSQTSLENDVNMFAFWAFTRPEQLQKLASRYERIGRKYQLFVEFYRRIDPAINIGPPAEASPRTNRVSSGESGHPPG